MYVELEILTYRIADKCKGLLFRMHLSDY
jgi:hypothetical protein